MKRFVLTLLTVIALSICAMIPALFKTSGQGEGRFRRTQPEKRIHNQYIVVLKNDADPDAEAARLSRDFGGDRSDGHTYRRGPKGVLVRLSGKKAQRMGNDPRGGFVGGG